MTDELVQQAQQTFHLEHFKFSPTELSPRGEEFDMDQWERLGEFIRLTNQACQWWWGDWLNMGEQQFGERASQALESTRWDEETLRVYAWVCRNVPRETRVPGVPFSHYQCLAKLPEGEQREWAEKVVDDQMSLRQLRHAMKNGSGKTTQPCLVVRCKTSGAAERASAVLLDLVSAGECEVELTERAVKA